MKPRLRGFEPDDLEAVLTLRLNTFEGLDAERERRRWVWEFDQNPVRRDDWPLTWVLDDGGRIVGNFGMIPMRVKIGDGIHHAYDGIDLCLDPAYQGQGLASLLGEAFMDPNGGAFPFVSAPVPATTHLMVSRGGTMVGGGKESITWILTEESPLPSPAGEVTVRSIETFDDRFDRLWQDVSAHYPLLIVRDPRYLNWRYRDFPFGNLTLLEAQREGTLTGFAVLQEDKALDRHYILEFFAAPRDQETQRALLRAAIEKHREVGLGTLAMVTRQQETRDVLAEAGFFEMGGDIPAYVGKIQIDEPGVRIEDWYVTLGDGDMLYSVG